MSQIPSAGPVSSQFAPALASVRGGGGDPGHRPPSYSSYYWSSPFPCWWPGRPASCRSSWCSRLGGLPALFQFHTCCPLLLYEKKCLLTPLSCSTYSHTAAVSASRSVPTRVWTPLGQWLCLLSLYPSGAAHSRLSLLDWSLYGEWPCWKPSSGKH